ncbi:MAG TPA: protein kinase, partial [Verrucomicrobiae bacterium]|nr:protein kinase [Verrucomicrobiae bacterium]
RAVELSADLPEAQVAQAWVKYARGLHDDAIGHARLAIERKRDCEGAYYLLGRALFAAGRYQEVASITDAALDACGEDYNVYVPLLNALGALGKDEQVRNVRLRRITVLENHLKKIPEDARARIHLAVEYANMNRVEDSKREADLAVALRPNDATVLYNAACVFCLSKKKPEALEAIRKAWDAGFRDPDWARRDPDLALLHGDPEFDRLYPETKAAG